MMSILIHEARASYAFIERNMNLIKRYWGWELVWLTYSVANSLAIAYIGAGMGQLTGQSVDTQRLVLFLLIGTLVWSYLSVVFDAISDMIAWERWEGTIEYTFMAPVSRLTHMLGVTAFAVVYGIWRTLIILGAVVLFFRIDLSGANLPAAMVLLLAGSFSFIGFGIMAAVLPLLFPERGTQMTHAFQAILLLISGVYYPIEVLPGWMQPLTRLSPATYVLTGMRQALLDGSGLGPLVSRIILLLAMSLVTIPLGLVIFGWAERYAKQAGKLKRSG